MIRIKDPTGTDVHKVANLTRQQIIENLRELITALGRRVPRLERAGEAGIARDAAALKHEALARIATLERSGS
jgi:hypothetical protein